MSDAGDDRVQYSVGDSDLEFLGLAATVAARFEFARKRGRMRGYEDFPQSDLDASRRVQVGAIAASRIPPDDIRDVSITVTGSRDTINWLLDLARRLEEGKGGDDA